MAYYVYPVYVLACLIILIILVICLIYSLHLYKFVKNRVVVIKLEQEELGLNSWTFDLYPFSSSRVWRVCGYAIVCLPSTFHQTSNILVCQCKVVKFKTVIPKDICNDKKGMITPVLKKKFGNTMENKRNDFEKSLGVEPVLLETKPMNCVDTTIHEEDEDVNLETPLSSCKANKPQPKERTNDDTNGEHECLKSEIDAEKAEITGDKFTDEKQESRFERITKKFRRHSRRDTVISLDLDLTEHNLSIMSIDNTYEKEYFIIPEAKPMENLVLFNEPFNSSCPICLDDFELEEEIALLVCHHGYHKDCLNKALRQNASCPYCKSESNVRTFHVSQEIPLLWQSMSRRNSQAVQV